MRIALLALLVLVPCLAQDQRPPEVEQQLKQMIRQKLAGQDEETQKRILDKIEKYLDEQFKKLGEDIKRSLQEDLSGKTPAKTTEVKPVGKLEEALDKVNVKQLKEIIEFLASDELEGRCTGYPGNDKATEYFAKIYEKAGLAPVGDKNEETGKQTYFQSFKVGSRKTRNTVAFLEGTDEQLKKEIVVIGGHHDHLGKGKQGPAMQKLGRKEGDDDIWNGADDNGSGSGTVVAMAKAFAECGLRAKRSILFMTFSGEEYGLLGSQHYCGHPIFPLENTVAMINLDMIGRNANRPVGIYGMGTEANHLFDKITDEAIQATGVKAKINQSASMMGGDSDHTSFRMKHIPVMFFFTGTHADYHTVRDHADKLDWDNIEKIGRCAARILWSLANSDQRPEYAKGKTPKHDFSQDNPPTKGRRLGIMPEYNINDDELDALKLGKEEGAVKVSQVSSGTVAEAAGLKDDDWIVKFDGKAFPRGTQEALVDLKKRINAAKAKTDVEIEVIRDGKRVTLKARWDE